MARLGLPPITADHRAAVDEDYRAGIKLGVKGSPHFFTPGGDFFCPTLDIHHGERGYDIQFDAVGFQQFISAAFG